MVYCIKGNSWLCWFPTLYVLRDFSIVFVRLDKLILITTNLKIGSKPHLKEIFQQYSRKLLEPCTRGFCLVNWYDCQVMTSAYKYDLTGWSVGLKAQLCWKTETNYQRLGEQQKAQSLGGKCGMLLRSQHFFFIYQDVGSKPIFHHKYCGKQFWLHMQNLLIR